MVNIITRSEWGARAPRDRSTTSWSARTEFVVHYSEGPPTQSVRSIQDFHMDSNGWSDIGYNLLVDREGRAYEGRGWLVVGAHATGHNTSGVGVCFIGRDGDATPAAKKAIRTLYDEANRLAGRTLARRGHRDVNSTDCPGDDLYAWVRAGMPADGSGGGGGDGGTAPPWPGVYLSYPPITRHPSVTTWQGRMRERGWTIAVDGAYGPASKRVCERFQAEKNIGRDGIVGPVTWRAAWEAPIT
ncbi:peptidoglycan hydrolase-like protein with peptidoglycan-binding domain [Spinactinospora alkalitolerans]|uniref:Peptidoglycan hydrolase-like protein with peptidoglycan-binding domain n=1 Tax=Spinactinospora alkalitolerans TaxID=687207 RepID=A0A852TWV8_9ACTN|nr:peptidoglycan-binding domain-containing protein [Spinactinospora alkalitolerans]NYE47323.1 peptidoglycan hydrolase-like protein with peptidoglycan-binding domain [Spinactinospora alkalitolerans]